MHDINFIHFFCIPQQERVKTTIYTGKLVKMAAVTIMRTYFLVVINISAETAWNIIDQGLDDFDSLVEFTKEYTKTLCTTIHSPGGMIINPRENIADQSTDPRLRVHSVDRKSVV